VTIAVLANDADADGDALSVTGLTQPTAGTVALNGDGTVTYTPNSGFTGTDSFTYKATDGQSDSDLATVMVQVSALTPATRVYENDSEQAIPDRRVLSSTIVISDTYSIGDINVQLDISHARVSDLQVFLIGPDGTVVELFSNVGGTGSNFANTLLDDEEEEWIGAGAAPFTGAYKPTGDLSAFDGKAVTGTWTLEIWDTEKKMTGTLNSWSLIVEPL
jgi:subtilisin-like proprotein convertase family protein